MRNVIFVPLLLVSLAACQKQYVQVDRLRPAPIFVAHYKTVGVATLEGEFGDEVADLLHHALEQQKHQCLVDRRQMAAEQMRVALAGMTADEASRLAQRVGAEAVLTGQVQEVQQVKVRYIETQKSEYTKNADGAHKYKPGTGYYHQTASLDVVIHLDAVDAQGKRVGSTQFSLSSRPQQDQSSWGWFGDIPWDDHRRDAYAGLASGLRRQVTPAKQADTIVLYETRNIPESSAAIAAVRARDWQQAIQLYREGVRRLEARRGSNKYRSRAHYNLGITLVYAGYFDEGISQLKMARDLQTSDELDQIIAQANVQSYETTLAKHQLDILGGRVQAVEIQSSDDKETLEPWPDDGAVKQP